MALLDPAPVEKWLADEHDGARLIAFTRVMTPANIEVDNMGGGSVGSTEATRQVLGFDPDNRSWLLGGSAGLLVLTATNFLILRLGGFKEKIKSTAFDAPRDQMSFVANDVDIDGRTWRHWAVTGFPDGRYLLEPQVLAKGDKPSKIAPGSDAFLAALGDGVRHITPGAPAG